MLIPVNELFVMHGKAFTVYDTDKNIFKEVSAIPNITYLLPLIDIATRME